MPYKINHFLPLGLIFFSLQGEPADDFSQGVSHQFSPEQIQSKNHSFILPTNHLYESQQLNNLYGLKKTPFQIPNIRKSVFSIHNKINSKSSGAAGTTFYIGNNRFVTNFHVIYPSFLNESFVTQRLFLNYKGKKIPFQKVLTLDHKNDLAVLELNQKVFEEIEMELVPLKLSPSSQIASHHQGFIYGFGSLFGNMIFSEFNFESYTKKKISGDLKIPVNSTNLYGSSGGPVLVGNQVVGVLKMFDNNVAFATSSEVLLSLLQSPSQKNHSFYILKEFFSLRAKALRGNKEAISYLNMKQESSFLLQRFFVHRQKNALKKLPESETSSASALFSKDFEPSVKMYITHQFYDRQDALKVYKSLAKEDFLPAISHLAFLTGKENKINEMIKLYERAGLKGEGFASYVMGTYKTLVNPSTDSLTHPISAEEWFKISLQQAFLPALFKLISFYEENGRLKEAENLEHILDMHKTKQGKHQEIAKAYKFYKRLENHFPVKFFPQSCLEAFK